MLGANILLLGGLISLIFGIVIMIFPKILNYLEGFYFILIGVLAIIRHFT